MSRTSSTSRSRAASPAVRDLATVERNLPRGWTVDAKHADAAEGEDDDDEE